MKKIYKRILYILAAFILAMAPLMTYAAPFSTFVGGTGVAGTLSGLIKGNGTSPMTAGVNGTDFTLITAISCAGGNHVSAVTAAGVFTCSADTGSGGSAAWPFTTGTFNFGVLVQSTTTPESFVNGVFASSTSQFVNASTTNLTVFSNEWHPGLTASKLLALDNNGLVIASSTIGNGQLQFSTISGVALGGTLSSLSNDAATLSGTSYNGSAAVSNWAINLNNANTWTGLQKFSGAGTTTIANGVYASAVAAPYINATSTTATSTFLGFISTQNINLTGTNATSTAANGISLSSGCFSVAGTCVGGSGGVSGRTKTTQVEIPWSDCAPMATSTVFAIGGSFFQPDVISNVSSFTSPVMTFGFATTSEMDCLVHLPADYSSGLTLQVQGIVSTSTSGTFAMDIWATSTKSGQQYNTPQFALNIVSTSTTGRWNVNSIAGNGTSTPTYDLSTISNLIAGDDVMIRLIRYGASTTADTIRADAMIHKLILNYTTL